MEKINLQTTSSFILTFDETRSLYLRLALYENRPLRVPEYKEELLLKKLTSDFKKLTIASKKLVEQNPNDYGVHKIASFFDRHYKKMLELQNSARLL